MSELFLLSFGMSKDLFHWFQDGWRYIRQSLHETIQFILEWMLEKTNLHAKCISFVEVKLLFLLFLMSFGCWTWNLTELELGNQMVELWFVKFFSTKVGLFRFRLHFEDSIWYHLVISIKCLSMMTSLFDSLQQYTCPSNKKWQEELALSWFKLLLNEGHFLFSIEKKEQFWYKS